MPSFTIAIPDSVLRDAADLRAKTVKVGELARAAAVHRVTELIIYQDPTEKVPSSEKTLLLTLLRYIETPQYLRKALFPLQKELRFAGLLPPLATPHHPITSQLAHFHDNEVREGVIVKKLKHHIHVDVGAEVPIPLLDAQHLHLGERVTVIVDKATQTARLMSRADITEYWGFLIVSLSRSLGTYLKQLPPQSGEIRIATSRTGTSFTDIQSTLVPRLNRATKILIAFGSPKQGISAMLTQEGIKLFEVFDFCLNMLPWGQGTRTVRVEEAIHISLSLIWSLLIQVEDIS
ncbi:MAG: putative RNA uridine N3 methyltransferase [Candidatus Heimdallarchaeota archaeon]